eukprot:scaffold26499_cov69-Phaeocystis_antarctica.AAC.2
MINLSHAPESRETRHAPRVCDSLKSEIHTQPHKIQKEPRPSVRYYDLPENAVSGAAAASSACASSACVASSACFAFSWLARSAPSSTAKAVMRALSSSMLVSSTTDTSSVPCGTMPGSMPSARGRSAFERTSSHGRSGN